MRRPPSARTSRPRRPEDRTLSASRSATCFLLSWGVFHRVEGFGDAGVTVAVSATEPARLRIRTQRGAWFSKFYRLSRWCWSSAWVDRVAAVRFDVVAHNLGVKARSLVRVLGWIVVTS